MLIRNFVDLILKRTTQSIAPLSAGIVSAEMCLAAKEASEGLEYIKI